MKVRFLLGFVFMVVVLSASQHVHAQCKKWIWPEDKATAEEKNVLYSDAVKSGQYREAVAPWQWLMTNTPNLNASIYINGEKIYNALAKAEKDPVKKVELVDSLLWVVDRRIEVCGEEKKRFPRKVLYNYSYNITNKEKTEEIFEMFEKVFELLGKDVDRGIAQAYVTVLKAHRIRNKALTDEEVLNKYDRLIEVIDNQVGKGKNIEKWEVIRGKADEMLIGLIKIDCDFVRTNLKPKFEENPDDIKLAKRIFGFMLIGKCTEDPLWLQAGKKIQEKEPAYGLGKNLGLKCKAQGDKDCAKKYFNEALGLASNGQEKADMYMQLGHLKSESGARSAARGLYKQALASDNSQKDAYTHIGNLYFRSFDECAGKQDKAKDRLVFIAAYNQFQKSGNAKLMSAAKAQFPSKEELFERNYNKGDVMSTGCWIAESVSLDTRD